MDFVPSDISILDLLRQRDSATVTQLAGWMDVTATAVRQRLTRLMAQGYVQRSQEKSGRGRPSHQYALTATGRRKTGANFADLATALWQEIREIKDPDVRRGLLQRVAQRMAEMYADQVQGDTVEERLTSISALFREKQMPFEVTQTAPLPILTALACPYPDLAEQDRSICALEKMLFSELVGDSIKLSACRLDGDSCCTFTPSEAKSRVPSELTPVPTTAGDSRDQSDTESRPTQAVGVVLPPAAGCGKK